MCLNSLPPQSLVHHNYLSPSASLKSHSFLSVALVWCLTFFFLGSPMSSTDHFPGAQALSSLPAAWGYNPILCLLSFMLCRLAVLVSFCPCNKPHLFVSWALEYTVPSAWCWKDLLEEDMATPSSILAWRIPWTEEPGRLQSMGLQTVRQDWSDLAWTAQCTLFPIIIFSSSVSLETHLPPVSPPWRCLPQHLEPFSNLI